VKSRVVDVMIDLRSFGVAFQYDDSNGATMLIQSVRQQDASIISRKRMKSRAHQTGLNRVKITATLLYLVQVINK
jgi:hypothetical protein